VEQNYAGRSGDVGGYQVEIGDDEVRVLKEGVELIRRRVEPHAGRSLADVVAAAGRPRLRWGRLPDGDEVIIVFDAAAGSEDALSYAINVSDPARSGWTHGNDLLAAVEAAGH
jgi:hypothetical protein